MDIQKLTTEEILNELLRREPLDNSFELQKTTPVSYTFKFFRFD